MKTSSGGIGLAVVAILSTLLATLLVLAPNALALAGGAFLVLGVAYLAGSRRGWMLAWSTLFLVGYERLLFVTGALGAQGALPLLLPMTALVFIIALFLRPSFRAALDHSRHRALPIVLYLGYAMALPVIALLLGASVRALLGSLVPLASFTFLILGLETGAETEGDVEVSTVLLVSTAVHAVTAALQMARFSGIQVPLAATIAQFDAWAAGARGVSLSGTRAVGLFLNPNVVSLHGAVAIVYAVSASSISSRKRFPILILGLVLLLGGQSRGVALALLVTLIIVFIVRLAQEGVGSVTAQTASAAAALLLVVVAVARYAPESGARIAGRLATSSILDPEALAGDIGFSARLGFWRGALAIVGGRPLGTITSPEAVLGTAIDNDFVRVLVHGGIVYLALYVWQYLYVMKRALGSKRGLPSLALSVLMVFAAISQTVSVYAPFMVIYMLVVGSFLARERE